MGAALAAAARKLAMQLAKKLLKDKMNGKNPEGKMLKIILAIVAGVVIFAFLLITILFNQYNNIICRGIMKNVVESCPRPFIDEKVTKSTAALAKYQRDKLIDETLEGERFRGSAESLREGSVPLTEAELIMLIMEQLDSEVRGIVGYKDSAYHEGGEYADSNYGKTLKNAMLKEGRVWDLVTNKEMTHYFMDQRLRVWQCYWAGGACGAGGIGYEKLVPETYENVPVQFYWVDVCDEEKCWKKKKPTYMTIYEMLTGYYEVSLYQGRPNGKEEYMKRLGEVLQDNLYNKFPQQPPGNFELFETGWILPMEKGTYNFAGQGSSQDYGDRDTGIEGASKDHKGVDFGTGGKSNIPIYAMKDGIVAGIGTGEASGGTIVIDHQNGFFTHYQHLQHHQILVKPGQVVSQGQMIGAAGDVGVGGAIHLHWEVCKSTGRTYGRDLPNPSQRSVRCSNSIDPASEEVGITLTATGQTADKQAAAAAFFAANEAKARNGEKVLMPGFVSPTAGGGLGSVSAKYESSGDPGICVHNASDP